MNFMSIEKTVLLDRSDLSWLSAEKYQKSTGEFNEWPSTIIYLNNNSGLAIAIFNIEVFKWKENKQ